ncbi:enoyl-CoA hydratase/isomerase family protein [Aeromicrobium phragmitis]|nr:enoyl-CoA hydratase/isomerase family protein [Aeromicrobium phragmitis]
MSSVLVEQGAVESLRLRLNRPEQRNALTLADVDALIAAMAERPHSPVVIESATAGMFCAGASLSVSDPERARLSDRLYELYEAMLTRPGLTIALVDGPAVGGGAQLSAAADLRIATERARWRWVGPGHGLVVGAWIATAHFGRARGLNLTLTARWLAAQEAEAAGYVPPLVTDTDAACTELLEALRAMDAHALSDVKRATVASGLITELQRERTRNRLCWDGHAPSQHRRS